MKKSYLTLVTAIVLFTGIPNQVKAAVDSKNASTESKTKEAAKADMLLTRLYEIHSMDKSDLTPPQKTKLRNEVYSIKTDLKELGDGVYISVGAIIIILLLVIILL